MEDFCKKLAAYSLPSHLMAKLLGGTSAYYKQALALLLAQQARKLVKGRPRHYYHCTHLLDPMKSWQHRHYTAMAELLGISESTTKRLFSCYRCHERHSGLAPVTLNKVADFLDTKNLDEKIIGYIISNGLKDEQ